ncbi:MAG: threonine synthase [SAR202 cluster bacterium Io17-Chloro-G3]|nr:MAG: threonine synthase [SAR202 cluster bacterium Io17-Chloro-G3]
MAYVSALRCRSCGRDYKVEPINVCEFCFGPLEVVYDYEAIARNISRERIAQGPLSMWRYQDLLPVDAADAVDIGAGFTPLIKSVNLAKALGLSNLYIKNDAVNPSYSFKDRVVSVAATKAREFGFDTIACASTGNLACSVAAHAARGGMKSYVFIPANLERGKVVGAAIYDPTLVAVEGSYDEVNRLCSELADSYHWAFVNINIRPYYAEGSKTLAYEVAEQLGWRAPDHAIVPLASGSMFTKIWKGFNEMADLGLISKKATSMHATQAAGCSPIIEAYEAGTLHVRPVRPNTIAKSLAIGNPADGLFALKTIQDSDGSGTSVPEEDIVDGIKLLAETEGVFTETAGGVAVAGLKRLVELERIGPDEVTVLYITGNGLKTQEAVEEVVNPLMVNPTIESFEAELQKRTNSTNAR